MLIKRVHIADTICKLKNHEQHSVGKFQGKPIKHERLEQINQISDSWDKLTRTSQYLQPDRRPNYKIYRSQSDYIEPHESNILEL